jgi:hypothetical protein
MMFSSKFYVELFMITVMSLQFSWLKSDECVDLLENCADYFSWGYSCDNIRKWCRKSCGCPPLGLIKTIYYFE